MSNLKPGIIEEKLISNGFYGNMIPDTGTAIHCQKLDNDFTSSVEVCHQVASSLLAS